MLLKRMRINRAIVSACCSEINYEFLKDRRYQLAFLYSLGNILILLSLSFRKVIYIRSIFVLSDLCFLLYGLLTQVAPMIYWAVATLVINLVQIGVLLRDMLPIDLSPELQQIKNIFFDSMQASDFLRVIKLSSKGTASNEKMLIQGQPVTCLLLITKGQVYVEVEGSVLELGAYHFIGEMSYFHDSKASATIYAHEPVEYLYWNYADLHRLQEKKPRLFMKMIEAMGKDIMLKMLSQNKSEVV